VPAGGDVSVNVAAAGLIVRLTGPVVVSCGLLESVALTVSFTVPATVGVPLTRQPDDVSVRPAGSVPFVIMQEYGDVPPVTPIVWLYGTFTVPFGSVDTVSINDAGSIVRLTGPTVISCGLLESVAFTVKFTVPATVGVPLTRHPAAVSVSPAGSVPVVIVHE
jgi:hypothetical protein